jgi:hypothetical protein
MPQKQKHSLLTRWFSRRVDLGALLAGFLFVFIWALLPAQPGHDAQASVGAVMRVQPVRNVLAELPDFERPDLMLVPSRHTFKPVWELPDVMARVPQYRYASRPAGIQSQPEGMMDLPGLGYGLYHGYDTAVQVPLPRLALRSRQPASSTPRLRASYSHGLAGAKLRTDLPVWETDLAGAQPWRIAFWIALDAIDGEFRVFVEERSGDAERDSRLLRTIQRPDVWENPAGEGIVWLRYQPASGEEHAHQND